MRRLLLALPVGLAAVGTGTSDPPVTAFRDVHVVPMDRERVLRGRTVVVRDGRVAAILPRDAALPRGARIIEGWGAAYLLPGLADMHVHLLDRDELLLYLASGVTTVRNLHGLPLHLAWRDSLARGTLLGPRLLTSGPILDGAPPARGTNLVLRTPADAERAVAQQKAAGYDAIKVYDNLPAEVYRALLQAGRRHGMPVTGHVPTPVGLDGLLESGGQRSIEHAEELLPFFADGRDTSGVGAAAAALARAGVWVVPTLSVHASALEQARDVTVGAGRSDRADLNPETARRGGWDAAAGARAGNAQAVERFSRTTAFFRGTLVPALRRAGVKLLAGSDAPIPTIVPGRGLGSELRELVAAGLTPYDALVAATRHPAEFLGRGSESGTVAPGRAADLLLLAADPLVDLAALDQPLGVMVRGRWYPAARLEEMLARQRERYAKQAPSAAR